jgi:hypothetical protein
LGVYDLYMPTTDPVTVYLDMNHWYALGAARVGRPGQPEHVEIFERLQELVAQGRLICPLSAVHYMELTENPRAVLRQEAASAMILLSTFSTLPSIDLIVQEELEQELHRLVGKPDNPMFVPKLGWGAGFAFGQPMAVEPSAELVAKLGDSVEEATLEANYIMEKSILESADATRNKIPGYNPNSARDVAHKQLATLKEYIAAMRDDSDFSKRPVDAIYAWQLSVEILDQYTRALMKAGYIGAASPFRSKEEMTDFVDHLPSRRVAARMYVQYVKNHSVNWKINDLRDVAALSLAIPYCDMVVTDRKAWNAANEAKLGEEFGTTICATLKDLVANLRL